MRRLRSELGDPESDPNMAQEIAADVPDLVRVFRDILERARTRPVLDVDADAVTVGQMIEFVRRRLTMEDKPVALRQLLRNSRSERAVIAMFLALLELVRLQAILLRQDHNFSEIFIKKHENLSRWRPTHCKPGMTGADMTMTLWSAFLLTFTALLPLINPLGSALVFLGLVGDVPPHVYRTLARRIAVNNVIFLAVIELIGSAILNFFGISLPIVELAGGIVIAAIGWGVLNEKDSNANTREKEEECGVQTSAQFSELKNKTFYPFTFPVTSGPGTLVAMLTLAAHISTRTLALNVIGHVGRVRGCAGAECARLLLLCLCAAHHGSHLAVNGAWNPARGCLHPAMHWRADCLEWLCGFNQGNIEVLEFCQPSRNAPVDLITSLRSVRNDEKTWAFGKIRFAILAHASVFRSRHDDFHQQAYALFGAVLCAEPACTGDGSLRRRSAETPAQLLCGPASGGNDEGGDGYPHPSGGIPEGTPGRWSLASCDRRRSRACNVTGGYRYARQVTGGNTRSSERKPSRRCHMWISPILSDMRMSLLI